MSYDFYGVHSLEPDDERWVDPEYSDEHPALGSDGVAGTAVVTSTGYARCGNYTSNVSSMWTLCLAHALLEVPAAMRWRGDDARAFNATGRTVGTRSAAGGIEWGPMKVREDRLCLRDLRHKRCGDLVALLTAAVEWGIAHLDKLRELNPENGWGDAEGAVTYLWDMQRFCEEHPDLYLGLSS